jgi:protein-tyrosine phosphatase
MNHLIAARQLSEQITCDSAGTASYHVGSPPDRRMAVAASQRGIALKGQARQFHPSDFETFDLILAMDKQNYANIVALDSEGLYRQKVRLMCEFCRHHPDQEVPDPYYGGDAGFNYVIDLLLDACEGLLDDLVQTQLAR